MPISARMAASRPLLLLRGLAARRDRPDLARLMRETDPERFVWGILPHAARSFAASIAVLPKEQATAAAVGYLYCRMLDSYEDLLPDPAAKPAELRRFGTRLAAHLDGEELPLPRSIAPGGARDDRDLVHLLLVERCGDVDTVFLELSEPHRLWIAELVQSMADGMVWAANTFAEQDGVLVGDGQVAAYCHHVMGNPALFAMRLLAPSDPTERQRGDAMEASEMIQLANVTRDIERDLERGIGYHADLAPFLGNGGSSAARQETIRLVREHFLVTALDKVAAYRRLYDDLAFSGKRGTRLGAVLMLLFTDLHYRRCAVAAGHQPWRGPNGRFRLVTAALPAVVSRRWARRIIEGVERDFSRAARDIRKAKVAPAG